MTTPSSAPGTPGHAVHLRLVQRWTGDFERARQALAGGAAGWLGSAVPGPADRPNVRRFESDLALPVRGQAAHMVIRKAALVDLGPVARSGESLVVEVRWRSASLAPLFPVFVGVLTVSPQALILDGYYAPPGGELGVILDRALLNIAARGTARWFLSRVASEAESGGRPG
ncbi:MAG: hypothetical protein ACP5VP_06380 [Candidatus Limnocylindrales bacterium]